MRIMNAVRYIFRGISQIFFTSHALFGAVVTAILAIFDPRFAAIILIGCAASAATAQLAGDKETVKSGIVSFNGALFAAISTVYSGYTLRTVAFAILGGIACAILFKAFTQLFQSAWLKELHLPVASAPFAIIATPLFAMTGLMKAEWDLTTAEGSLGVAFTALNGIAEVFFADGWLIGALLLIAAALFNRTNALFIAIGAAIGAAGAPLLHGIPEASTGLFTYCTILASMAVGGVFWADRPMKIRLVGGITSAALVLLIQPLLAATGLPVTAWPFLIALWITIGLDSTISSHRSKRTPHEKQAAQPESADMAISALQ